MRNQVLARSAAALLSLMVVLTVSSSAFGAATIVIQNGDPAGVGFNDATPVAPVGGNSGTTLGQQRLNAFQFAANVWGATLTSTPTINIQATWEALTCTSSSAVLGSAGAVELWRDFAGAPFAGTWYGSALANRLFGADLNAASAEIRARFNVNLGNTGCLDGVHFYYGLDNIHGTDVDLVTVLLHEFSHGLGFQTFTSASTGAETSGFPSIYDRFLMDDSTGKTWVQMTDAERVTSALNTRKLAWSGAQVTANVSSALAAGTPLFKVNSPVAIAGNYNVGTASFGPPLFSPGITGNVVQALDPADGSGPSTTDACSALTNAGAITGNIALVDRGTCTFVTKVKNAQNAGAIGVVVANNVTGSPPPGMGGSDATITIPSAMIAQDDGTAIKAQLAGGVNAKLLLDLSARSGADQLGQALLFTPNPFQSGSSVSHWDSIAFPNQLMEPNINGDLTHSVTPPQDLTFSLLRDVGWLATPPSTLQFSAANYNAGEGDGSTTITVTRSGDTSGAATVDFATSDGSALQTSDYATAVGTLSFAPGDTSKTFSVLLVDDAYVEPAETINLTLANPTGATLGSPNAGTITITDNDTVNSHSPASKMFIANLTGGQESPATNSTAGGGGAVLLSQDETTASTSLLFSGLSSSQTAAHIHGAAPPGMNAPAIFPLALGTITNFQITPTAQQVANLKSGLDYMNVHSTMFSGGEIRGQLLWNPLEEASFFVQQHYSDFLNRVPDPSGFAFWQGQITQCGSDVQCLRNKRVDVSNAFFYELEFQQTGAYVYRLYRAAYGNNQPFPNPNNSSLPSYAVFVSDRARVVGGANLAQLQLDLANAFVARPELLAKYAANLTGPQFVDAVLGTIQNEIGVNLTPERTNLINLFNSSGRGAVIYRLADDNVQTNPINNRPYIDAEYNRAFVATQYFGYLRRDPDAGGFNFWLSQVNSGPLRDVTKQHAMVCSFETSAEYQLRFSSVRTRFNTECP